MDVPENDLTGRDLSMEVVDEAVRNHEMRNIIMMLSNTLEIDFHSRPCNLIWEQKEKRYHPMELH